MRRMGLLAAIAALAFAASCGPNAQKPAEQGGSGPPPVGQPLDVTSNGVGCAAASDGAWEPVPGEAWTLAATAEGATCDAATAVVAVRNPAGAEALRIEITASASPVLFATATTPETMADALSYWVELNPQMARTSQLPTWPDGAEQPASGELPFYVEEGVDRAAYEAIRAQDLPMLCLIQGGESTGCYALEAGKLKKVGAQSFPG